MHDGNVMQMKKTVAGRHETVNMRFKFFKCLQGLFRHNINMHSAAFRCVAVLVQLSIEDGDHLFDVEYYNYN